MNWRTGFVQVVIGMFRYKKATINYRLMTWYHDMKKHKGAAKSIIATSRKINSITYAILKSCGPFDPTKKEIVREKADLVSGERPPTLVA